MIWGRADVIIIELKCTINVTPLNHSETIPPVRGKIIFMKLIPGAKNVEDHCCRVLESKLQISLFKIFMCFLLVLSLSHSWRERFFLTLFMFSKWVPAFEKAISSYWAVTSPRVSRREKRLTPKAPALLKELLATTSGTWQVLHFLSFSLSFPMEPTPSIRLSSSAL